MLHTVKLKSLILGVAALAITACVSPLMAQDNNSLSTVVCKEAERAYMVFSGATLQGVEVTEDAAISLEQHVPTMVEVAKEVSGGFTLSGSFVYKHVISGQLYAAVQGYRVDPATVSEEEMMWLKPTIGCYMPM